MLTNEPLCAVFVYCFLAALGLCCGLQSSLVTVCELSSWSTWA